VNETERFQEEFSVWEGLLEVGKKESNLTLTRQQENYLASLFIKTHRSSEFLEKLHSNAVLTMKMEAERLEGQERRRALMDVGDICLIKAGFPKLISRHLTRVIKYSCMSMIYVGRGCFRSLADMSFSRNGRSSHWDEVLFGLDNMIGVLWASQENGYPRTEELIEMWRTEKFPCATHALKRRSLNVVYDNRFLSRSN